MIRARLKQGVMVAIATLGAVGAPHDVAAAEVLSGPVQAHVLEVIDGDTVLVQVRVWLGQVIEVRVRIAGIDAPALRGECAAERELAARARDFLAARLNSGEVRLREVRYGKYAGRVLARVETSAGEDLAALLLAAALARAYDGGARAGWCAAAALSAAEG